MSTAPAPIRATIPEPRVSSQTPGLGDMVLYHAAGQPERAAIVGNVHEDGRTLDLVVLLDGDPALAITRQAWSLGNGVFRMRAAIPCKADDPAGVRHWTAR